MESLLPFAIVAPLGSAVPTHPGGSKQPVGQVETLVVRRIIPELSFNGVLAP